MPALLNRLCFSGFRAHAHEKFVEGRTITDDKMYQRQIALAQDVARTLRENVIQGVNNGQDNVWSMSEPKRMVSGVTLMYFFLELQWRPEIELGDNETIKTASQAKKNKSTTSW